MCWMNIIFSCMNDYNIFCFGPSRRDWGDLKNAEDRLMGSGGGFQYLTMSTENPTAGDLAPAPLVTCKLCLCEQSLDKMTTLQECRCLFCTAVSFPWRPHREREKIQMGGSTVKGQDRLPWLSEKPGFATTAFCFGECFHLWICLQVVSWVVNLVFTGFEAKDNVCVKFNYWLNKQNLFFKD